MQQTSLRLTAAADRSCCLLQSAGPMTATQATVVT